VHRRGVELEEAMVGQRVAGGCGAWCKEKQRQGVSKRRG
jgi:hypothetical protein